MSARNRIDIVCDWCGMKFEKCPSVIKKHNFCCRACLANFSNKAINPKRYNELNRSAGSGAEKRSGDRRTAWPLSAVQTADSAEKTRPEQTILLGCLPLRLVEGASGSLPKEGNSHLSIYLPILRQRVHDLRQQEPEILQP